MKCEDCGNQMNQGDKFCSGCGAKVSIVYSILEGDRGSVDNKKNNIKNKTHVIRNFIVILVLFGLTLSGLWLYNYNSKRKECEESVRYVPDGDSPLFSPGERRERGDPYHVFEGQKFESREEAIKACMIIK